MSAPAPSATRSGQVLLVVSAGVFLASLDLFIVNLAFPELGRAFGTSTASLSWVLNGYTIGFAALLAPAGRTADRVGRRKLFLLGLAVFTLASAGCAGAWGVGSLVAFRVLQSTGAALVMATSLALLLASVPPAGRSRAIAVWSMTGGVAAALGPPLGGLLVEVSWRGIFLVNVPVGIAALLLGRRVLPESRDAAETRVPDLPGTAVLVGAVALLSYALVRAPEVGWGSTATVLSLAASAVLLVGVVARAAVTPAGRVPVLPLPLFRVRTFAVACLAGTAFFTAFGAMLLGNVLWLTSGWHLSPVAAGFALVPGPALAALTAVPGGRLGARFGCGPVAAVGTALFAGAGLWWTVTLGTEQSLWTFLPGQVLSGVGVGLTITNLSSAVSSTLPPAALATGTATFSAARQLGATLGVSLLLAVGSGAGTPLDGARRGWVLLAGAALLASLAALRIGRAEHVAPVPVPAQEQPVLGPVPVMD